MIIFTTPAWGLFDVGAVQFGSFRYKYHEENPELPPEPSYLNLRKPPKGPLTDALIDQLGFALHYVVSSAHVGYRAVVGVPEAGDPLVEAFVKAMKTVKVPQLWLEKEERNGERRIVPGSLARHMAKAGIKSGDRVLLVDDLITRAHSKLEAAEALQSEGLVVQDVAVLVDREQGGREALEKAGLQLHRVWGFIELMFFYYRGGVVSYDKYSEVIGHLRAQQKAFGLKW